MPVNGRSVSFLVSLCFCGCASSPAPDVTEVSQRVSRVEADVERLSSELKALKASPRLEPPGHAMSGIYSGTVHNKSVDVSGTGVLNLRVDKDGSASGDLAIGGGLGGSGAVQGNVHGEQVFLVSDSNGWRITWIGALEGSTLRGTYMAESESSAQEGTWSLTRP